MIGANGLILRTVSFSHIAVPHSRTPADCDLWLSELRRFVDKVEEVTGSAISPLPFVARRKRSRFWSLNS